MPARSRRAAPAFTRCRMMNELPWPRAWPKRIAESSWPTIWWQRLINATNDEDSVYPRGVSDRERILGYLRERSPGGAQNVAASIREAVAQLVDQPHSGYRTDN